MICPQCQTNNLIIRQADDSNYREVFCFSCGYRTWLKHFYADSKNRSDIRQRNKNK